MYFGKDTNKKIRNKIAMEEYVLTVTILHPEATEVHLYNAFEDFAGIITYFSSDDMQTGFVAGSVLLQFNIIEDITKVADTCREKRFQILGQILENGYALFKRPQDDTVDRINHIKVSSGIVDARSSETWKKELQLIEAL